MSESSGAREIDAYIASLQGWQQTMLTRLRALIHAAEPALAEEWKWGTPVFSLRGNVCAIGAFKDHVKVNVFKGAALSDPAGLFNAGLEAKTSRAIDLVEGQWLDEDAFKALIREAVAVNR